MGQGARPTNQTFADSPAFPSTCTRVAEGRPASSLVPAMAALYRSLASSVKCHVGRTQKEFYWCEDVVASPGPAIELFRNEIAHLLRQMSHVRPLVGIGGRVC